MVERTVEAVNRVQQVPNVKAQNENVRAGSKSRNVDFTGNTGSRRELNEAVEKINKALEIFNVERRFVIDDKTKEIVVKIIDKNTGEVIDQIPPEEALERYYEMQKFIGLIFNKRV